MKKVLIISACLSMLLAKSVTFDEILKETLKNNISLKAKAMDIQKAKAMLKEAKGYDFGKLIFTEEISRSNNALYVFGMKLESREASFRDFGFADFLAKMPGLMSGSVSGNEVLSIEPKNLNYPKARTNFKTKFVYEVPIFTGFKIKYAKEMAKLQVLANSYKYARDKEKLALEVLKAYNGAVAAKEFIKALKEAKKTLNSYLVMVNNFYKAGMVTKSDILQVKSKLAEVEAKLAEAKAKKSLAIAYLKFLSSDDSIDGVKDFKEILVKNRNLKELKKIALKNRSDLKWMQKNVDTMNAKVKMDKSVKYPTIGAHLEYGWNDNTLTLSGDKDYYVAAVGVNYNIFDKSSDAKIEQSKIDAVKTSYYYKYMKEGIKLEVEKEFLNLKTKEEILKQKLIAKNLAKELLNQFEFRYRQGMITMSELLKKETDLEKAKAEVVKARYDKAFAAAKLKVSLGKFSKEVR